MYYTGKFVYPLFSKLLNFSSKHNTKMNKNNNEKFATFLVIPY